ncbi:hypothetical protein [Flavobacterium notoginsengisoli]|uniref:hypothetical protein n=1 Tax=Flavobacterium notoginsengisoli TaxID=1478199 RepID=UPI003630ACE4
MNLVIIDNTNKKYHPYSDSTFAQEMFIRETVIAINKKNGTFLTVDQDCDIRLLDKQGFIKDQGMFEKLVWNYNENLVSGEKRLETWKRF